MVSCIGFWEKGIEILLDRVFLRWEWVGRHRQEWGGVGVFFGFGSMKGERILLAVTLREGQLRDARVPHGLSG
jgi:hypothetical protein